MTKSLIFHNPGEIDIRGACIAGLSAKQDESALGYFGTGLKYSIACILRWGGSVTIYSGTERYEFCADELNFRGQQFQQVVMKYDDGSARELNITTEYGKDWKAWQVFRELYANARDEGGGVRFEPATLRDWSPSPGYTHILVSGVPELEACYYERDEIILPEDKHWHEETSELQFLKSPSSYVFYKGVRVLSASCHYTWNFLRSLNLTEDRTLKDSHMAHSTVRWFITNYCKDESVITHMLHLWKTQEVSFEKLAMAWLNVPKHPDQCSPVFARAAVSLFRQEPVKFKELRELACAYEPSLADITSYKLSPREEKMLARAKALVSQFGFEREVSTIPIHVRHIGDSLLGLYRNDEIELSPNLFEQGMKQLVATLYEECYHAKTGHDDCTYQMQSSLFNIIISLNEDLHGVIC